MVFNFFGTGDVGTGVWASVLPLNYTLSLITFIIIIIIAVLRCIYLHACV